MAPRTRVRQPHRRADDAGTAARVGATGGRRGSRSMRRYGIDSTVLVSNADRGAARDRRVGRGRHAQRGRAPRHHRQLPLHAPHRPRRPRDRPRRLRRRAGPPRSRARHTLREDRGRGGLRPAFVAELALWERRWTDADAGRARRPGAGALARGRPDPRLALRQGTARTGGAGGARTRPPRCRRRPRLARSGTEADRASLAARLRRPQRSRRTPAAGWRWPRPSTSVRGGVARPELWSEAAATWDRLERPPLAAYCRWRQAEALVAAGASRTEASVPLREAHAVAARIGASPCSGSSSCSPSARGSISRRRRPSHPTRSRAWRRSSA